MNERLLNEFAAYYKRIIRVERYLKDLIYEKYFETHGIKAYHLLYKNYFENIKTRQNTNDKVFKTIFNDSNKNDKEKLEISIDKMYISEILALLSHKAFLKDKTRKIFFNKETKTNSNSFRKTAKFLKNFRNCICHYDIKQFLIEKSKFVQALVYFEKLVNCKYRFSATSTEVLLHNPSITSILKFIYNTHPEYFDDDRVLVNVFDDIARLIDFRTDNLPQYKSIIRQKFKTEGKK